MSDITMPDGVTKTSTTQDDELKAIVESNKSLQKTFKEVNDTNEDLIKTLDLNSKTIKKDKDYRDKNNKDEKKDRMSFLEDTKKSIQTNLENVQSQLSMAIQTPFSLVTEPLQKLTGLDLGGIFTSIKSDLVGKFKKGKKKPSENDVAETGEQGTGFLYLGEILKKIVGDKESDLGGKASSFLKGLSGMGGAGLAGIISSVLPKIAKVSGVGLIVSSLIWAVIDGVKGFFMSDDWGVSKISGFLGGFFASTGKGLLNAFKNAGKWAMLGAGIGLVGGPVGVLAGGLIGGAIGGILGFIGGEKLSKGFDTIGKFLVDSFNKIKEGIISFINMPLVQEGLSILKDLGKVAIDFITLPFKSIWNGIKTIVDKFKTIWTSEEDSIGKKIGKTIVQALTAIPQLIIISISNMVNGLKDIGSKLFGKGESKEGKKAKKAIVPRMVDFVKTLIIGAFEGFKSFISKIPQMIGGAISSVSNFAKDIIWPIAKDIFSGIAEQAGDIVNSIKNNPIIQTVLGALEKIFIVPSTIIKTAVSEFKSLFSDPKTWITDKMNGFFDFFNKMKDTIKEVFSDPKAFVNNLYTNITDSISNLLNGIRDFFGTIGSIQWLQIPKQLFSGMSFGDIFEKAGQDYQAKMAKESINDGIVTKTGKVIETSPDDNIFATKKEIVVSPSNGGSGVSNQTTAMLEKAIMLLASKIEKLEPKISHTTQVIKSFANSEDLLTFER